MSRGQEQPFACNVAPNVTKRAPCARLQAQGARQVSSVQMSANQRGYLAVASGFGAVEGG